MRKILLRNRKLWWAMALTIGLAPFTPPHLYEKIVWLSGGGKGMRFMDYFDIVMHGTPWVLLIISYILSARKSS